MARCAAFVVTKIEILKLYLIFLKPLHNVSACNSQRVSSKKWPN